MSIQEMDPRVIERLLNTQRVNGYGMSECNMVRQIIEIAKKYYTETSRIIEIGCHDGVSTEAWAVCVGHVDSVDTQLRSAMLEVLSRYPGRINHYKGMSKDFAQAFSDGTYDGVYIDGDHTYEGVKLDIACYLPKIKKGGILSGHDYSADWKDIIRAVDEIVGKPDEVYCDGSWVKKI